MSPAVERFSPEDFSRRYRFRMVSAYPDISGVPDAYEATEEDLSRGFERILASRNLRVTHRMYLADQAWKATGEPA